MPHFLRVDAFSVELATEKKNKEFPTGKVLGGAFQKPPRAARKRNFVLFSF